MCVAERRLIVACVREVRLECGKRFWGLEMPRSWISHTPLFALVKLELSVFCKKEVLALHTSIFRP